MHGIARQVKNVIGLSTYAPLSVWNNQSCQFMTKVMKTPDYSAAEDIAVPENCQTIRANTSQIKSTPGIPEFPTVYRTDFAQNAANKTNDLNETIQIGVIKSEKNDAAVKTGAKICKTCSERKYQDGSDDPGVSFKAPSHIAPGNAAAAVSAHEQEHVVREQAKAQQENREIISQSVQIYTAICPECGRTYVSGGKTTTTSVSGFTGKQNQFADLGRKYDAYA